MKPAGRKVSKIEQEDVKILDDGWEMDKLAEKTGKNINDLLLDSNDDWIPSIKEWAQK